ncbi:MAG: YkgJ family cysteine cluster protein [Gemmatimonadales bacterium]
MSRYTALPDPFVSELLAIPGFRELTEGFSLCPECERCERSLVYLSPAEQRSARELRVRLYGKGSATRLNRKGCQCPFYLGASGGCGHYADRPLICHLFPLDIIEHEEDETYWWVLFGACEEVARGKLVGRVEEARRLAAEIDRRMPDELRRSFMADADAAVFEPVFYDHPIHYLLPLTPPATEGR